MVSAVDLAVNEAGVCTDPTRKCIIYHIEVCESSL
jgi:hypothetical protein